MLACIQRTDSYFSRLCTALLHVHSAYVIPSFGPFFDYFYFFKRKGVFFVIVSLTEPRNSVPVPLQYQVSRWWKWQKLIVVTLSVVTWNPTVVPLAIRHETTTTLTAQVIPHSLNVYCAHCSTLCLLCLCSAWKTPPRKVRVVSLSRIHRLSVSN